MQSDVQTSKHEAIEGKKPNKPKVSPWARPEDPIEQVRVRLLPNGRMTRADAAKYLGRSPKTLAMWAVMGRGPPIHKVGGRCFYEKDDLDAMT